jgi:hypothetical protein
MSIGTINGHGSGMLWGLLASLLLHVLVVSTMPGFKVRFDDQRDILTVQIDSTPEPERVQMSEPVPEKVMEPIIPSPPDVQMPSERRIQPQKQPDGVPTEIVPPVPSVQRESTPENIPVLQAPKRTSSVSVQQPERDSPTKRESDNNRNVLPRPAVPVQPVAPIETVMALEPKAPEQPRVVAPRPAAPVQPVAPIETVMALEPKAPEQPRVVAPRPAAPVQPVAPIETVMALEPKAPEQPRVVAPRPAPPQSAVPVEPSVDMELELAVVEEYRREVHASLQALLQRDQKRGRSKVDAKHKGAKFKISLSFNAQGKIIDWKVAKKSEFERLDNYYLKLIKRLVDDGAFPAPPVERLNTTVVIIPIEIK